MRLEIGAARQRVARPRPPAPSSSPASDRPGHGSVPVTGSADAPIVGGSVMVGARTVMVADAELSPAAGSETADVTAAAMVNGGSTYTVPACTAIVPASDAPLASEPIVQVTSAPATEQVELETPMDEAGPLTLKVATTVVAGSGPVLEKLNGNMAIWPTVIWVGVPGPIVIRRSASKGIAVADAVPASFEATGSVESEPTTELTVIGLGSLTVVAVTVIVPVTEPPDARVAAAQVTTRPATEHPAPVAVIVTGPVTVIVSTTFCAAPGPALEKENGNEEVCPGLIDAVDAGPIVVARSATSVMRTVESSVSPESDSPAGAVVWAEL